LGTKITCLLDNEKDIEAVLAGVSGKNELKTVLARLAPKQQALIFGHAVPMPVAFRPRDWGTAKSYEEFDSGGSTAKQAEKDIKELFE
jgi:DNA helicase HerA-like ATPase